MPGIPGAATASVTASFSSDVPLQGEVYFGSGPGCQGLVEVATRDLHPSTIHHMVVVTGNDLRETVGDNGIIPGATYFFEVITLTRSGEEVDDNGGTCYSVTISTPSAHSTGRSARHTMRGGPRDWTHFHKVW